MMEVGDAEIMASSEALISLVMYILTPHCLLVLWLSVISFVSHEGTSPHFCVPLCSANTLTQDK